MSSPDVVSTTGVLTNDAAAGDAVSNDTTEDTMNRALSAAVVDPGLPQDTAPTSERATPSGGDAKPDTNAASASQQQHHATSSSLKAIMGTVASAPGPKPNPQDSGVAVSAAEPALSTSSSRALKSVLGVAGGATSVPGSTDGAGPPKTTAAAAAAVHGRAAGTDPTVDIPQLLVERGGRIRITALWEAYQNRFGETPYSLKDLFGEFSLVLQACVLGRPYGWNLYNKGRKGSEGQGDQDSNRRFTAQTVG